MSDNPPNNPLEESNEFKISDPNSFLKWFKEAFLIIVDRPFFWLMYCAFFSSVFAVSSNIIYLHTCSVLFFIVSVNLCRYFYSGKKTLFNMDIAQRHGFFIVNLLFFCILLKYLFWLVTATHTLFNSTGDMSDKGLIMQFSMSDYINPVQMISSGVWRQAFDLFLFNALVMPFHYIQLTIFSLFFSLSVFYYPLFIWKNNSAAFSYRLSLKVSLANAVSVSITMIVFILFSFLVYTFPLGAFPYLYILPSCVMYCMWADIFDEKKKTSSLIKLGLEINLLPGVLPNIKKEKISR